MTDQTQTCHLILYISPFEGHCVAVRYVRALCSVAGVRLSLPTKSPNTSAAHSRDFETGEPYALRIRFFAVAGSLQTLCRRCQQTVLRRPGIANVFPQAHPYGAFDGIRRLDLRAPANMLNMMSLVEKRM